MVASAKQPLQALDNRPRVEGLAFPDHEHAPAQLFEPRAGLGVPGHVAGEFRQPVVEPTLRLSRQAAMRVLMPEAAVDHYHSPMFRKHQVRRAWKVTPVKPKSKAKLVRGPSDNLLRPGVPLPDLSHVGTSGCRT